MSARTVIEEIFWYNEFPCVVVMQDMGFRCGYVGLKEGNAYYGKHYDDIPVDCHGGLTYSEGFLPVLEDSWDNKDLWWIGFDTGHLGDGYDLDAAIRLFKEYPETVQSIKAFRKVRQGSPLLDRGAVRTLEYCKNECLRIISQVS